MPGTVADSVDFLDEDGCDLIVARLQFQARQVRYWKRKAAGDTEENIATIGGRPRAESPSVGGNAQYQRVRRVARDMYCALSDRPESDQALAINELVETYVTRGVRLKMRKMTYTEREHYVAVRSAVHTLRTHYWTAGNWLELRLCKYIAMGVFTMGTKLFSKVQDADGSWVSPVLVPAPSNLNRARQDQIFHALRVPSPFRDPGQISKAQEELLKDHDVTVSDDGQSANIDIFRATSRAFKHARDNNNYIAPTGERGARAQILADGVTYYRMGRMATRFGTRVLGLKRWHNAKYYFSNVCLYLNGDHYPELKKYLGSIYDRVNAGHRMLPNGLDEVGNEQYTSALFTNEVACGACVDEVVEMEWTEGGDAAAGNSIGAMEPPPSVEGCCYYCECRKKNWFDRSITSTAVRRTLFRTSVTAHQLPPGAPVGSTYVCPVPGCGFEITAASAETCAYHIGLLTPELV